MTPEQATMLSDIHIRVVRIEEHCGPCQAMLDRHQEVIYGNGRGGLKTDITVLKEVSGRRRAGVIWQRGIIGTLIAAVLAMMATMVKALTGGSAE